MEKLAVCPTDCKSQPLGVKPTRGRPALSVQALLRQPRDSIINAGFTDDEDDNDDNNAFVVENAEPSQQHFSDTPENSNNIWSAITDSSTELIPVQEQLNDTELDDLLQSILAVELPPVVIIPSVAADIDTIPGPVLAAVAPVEEANDELKKRGRPPLSTEEEARRDELKQQESESRKRAREEAKQLNKAAKRSKN
jgi:hypothetical protein